MPEMCLPSKEIGSRVVSLLARLAVASLLLFGIAGCGTDLASQPAQMRVVHASLRAGPLNVFSSNSNAGIAGVAYDLSFGSVTTYFPVTASTYTVTSSDTSMTFASTQLNAKKAIHYTLLIQDAGGGVVTEVLTDQDQPAPAGHVSFRFANQMLNSGAVDLYAVSRDAKDRTVNEIAAGVSAGTSTGYIVMPAGTYTVNAMPSGSSSHDTTPAYMGAAVHYPSGAARTLVLLTPSWSNQPAANAITLHDYDPLPRQ